MIAAKLFPVTSKLKFNSVNLARLFSTASAEENKTQVALLQKRKKLGKERLLTFKAAQESVRSKQKDSERGIQSLIGGLGLGALARGMKGAPKARPVLRGRPRGRLPRIGGIANIAFTGLDFAMRKGEGQTNLQAGVGAAGGLVGGLGGMKAGAALGTLIAPGVGTLIGGALGGIAGSMLGGGLADRATGVTGRLKEEEQRTRLLATRTPFGIAIDRFDSAIDKFADYDRRMREMCAKKEEDDGGIAVVGTTVVPKTFLQHAKDFLSNRSFNDGVAVGALGTLAALGIISRGRIFQVAGKMPGARVDQGLGIVQNLIKRFAPKTVDKTPDTAVPNLFKGLVRGKDTPLTAARRSESAMFRLRQLQAKLRGETNSAQIREISEGLKSFDLDDLLMVWKQAKDRIKVGDQADLNFMRALFNEIRNRGSGNVPQNLLDAIKKSSDKLKQTDPSRQRLFQKPGEGPVKNLEPGSLPKDILKPARTIRKNLKPEGVDTPTPGPQASRGGTDTIAMLIPGAAAPMMNSGGGSSTETRIVPADPARVARYKMGILSEATA